MKKLLFKSLSFVFLAIIVLGAVLVLKNNGGVTGKVIQDATPVVKDGIDTVQQVVEDSGLKDIIKEKTAELLKPADSRELINKVIELKSNSKNKKTIKTAELVSEINKEVQDLKNPSINTAWQTIIGCVYDGCSDKDFINLIDAIVIQSLSGNNEIIHSIIETYNFWNGKNVIYFSEALSRSNTLIENLANEDIRAKWSEVVDCNSECKSFTNKIVELINLINNKQ